jgi:hypothetical protein
MSLVVLYFSLPYPVLEPDRDQVDVPLWPFAADVASYLFGSYRSNSGHAGRTDAHSKGANDSGCVKTRKTKKRRE